MMFLRLKFESAYLKHADVAKKSDEGKLGYCSLKDIENANWSCPIGQDQVSNMLHVMFGFPPKASHRNTVFERNEDIYELAGKSYIRYDNYDTNRMQNMKYASNLEFFQSAKPFYNSHAKVTTLIGEKDVVGYYTWNYFKRRFKGKKDLLKQIMDFFSDVCGVENVEKSFYFNDFIEEFHKHLEEEKVKEFFETYLYEGGEFWGVGKPLNKPYICLLKNEKNDGGNTSYNQPTPLLYNRGTGRKISFDGEIIVPIENDDYVEHLENYGTLPTLLDGGVVSIVSLSKKVPYPGFEKDFMLLSEAENWCK